MLQSEADVHGIDVSLLKSYSTAKAIMEHVTILVLLLVGGLTEGAKILAIFPFQTHSHNVMFESIMMGLVRAGHSVDVVSHFPPRNPVLGFNHISVRGTLPICINKFTVSQARNFETLSVFLNIIAYQEAINICDLMRLPQLQNIINTSEKYDVMMTEIFGTNCYLTVAHKLKIPVIGITSSNLYPWNNDPFFNNDNPSYIPSLLSGFNSEMGFIERLQNLYIQTTSKLIFHYYDRTVSYPLAKKYFDNPPPRFGLYVNMSLVLVNSHRSISGVRPINPAVIEVAGVHINESQELPEELEVFLNSAKDGIVYFSMGSIIRSDTFPIDKMNMIYESFSQLSNHKVLWKGKAEEMPKGLPHNVKMVPWVPQYPVLRHPNVKAFVTHGGQLGTLEAIYAEVPMIGIPFFADQASNIAGYALKGIAVRLNYEDITKASFSNALREVLTNPKYKSNIERVSRLLKDRPLSPIDEAVYWVEYVIRNGGESLKSSALHLYWFQYYLLDIGLFLLAITSLVFIVVFILIRKALGILGALRRFIISVKVKTN